jgi:hypothetical protein
LTAPQQRVVKAIQVCLPEHQSTVENVRRLLSQSEIETITPEMVERDLPTYWMPSASVSPDQLLSILRDLVGGGSRVRASFDGATLRARLREQHGVDIPDPEDWGSGRYRNVVPAGAIEVSGTTFARPIV